MCLLGLYFFRPMNEEHFIETAELFLCDTNTKHLSCTARALNQGEYTLAASPDENLESVYGVNI